MNKGGNGRLIRPQRSGQIKGIMGGEAVAAEMIGTDEEGNAATPAVGGLDNSQLGQTVGTEERQPGRFQPPLATQAERRKQQILKGLEI